MRSNAAPLLGLLALLDVPGLEVNGQPDRLDLDEWHYKLAKEIGVKLVLSTDAHSTSELGFMRFAVDQARRGWLEPSDILNTRRLDGLRATLRRP